MSSTFGIAPGHELVSVAEADLELPDGDDLLLRPVEIAAAAARRRVVKVAPDDVDVGGERLEVLEGVARAQVAGAEDVLDATVTVYLSLALPKSNLTKPNLT